MATCSSVLLFLFLAPCVIVGNPSEKRLSEAAISYFPRERRCEPVLNEKGVPITCHNDEISARVCPRGTQCVDSSDGTYGMCCNMESKQCPDELLVTDEKGEPYVCQNDIISRVCPENSQCLFSSNGLNGVCYKNNREPRLQCKTGEPARDDKGVEYNCGFGRNHRDCPKGTQCQPHRLTASAACCQVEEPKCALGDPVRDEEGVEYFCGRGPTHRDCPDGTQCHISPVDAYAVCCKQEEPTRICPIGKPMVDDNGNQYRCDPTANGWDCPYNGLCITTPDGYGVCCPPDKTARRCLLGGPLTDDDGVEYFCGKASCHRNCPKGYRCDVSTRDGSAVCCLEDIIEFPQFPPLEQ